ncbi:MAG: hypothetical protein Q8N47_16930 [Bryobacterales bacterium]|nr:hypothetical protein [Bryobacterales bacterium]
MRRRASAHSANGTSIFPVRTSSQGEAARPKLIILFGSQARGEASI